MRWSTRRSAVGGKVVTTRAARRGSSGDLVHEIYMLGVWLSGLHERPKIQLYKMKQTRQKVRRNIFLYAINCYNIIHMYNAMYIFNQIDGHLSYFQRLALDGVRCKAGT